MRPFLFAATVERITDDQRVDVGNLTMLLETNGFRVLSVAARPAEPFDDGQREAVEPALPGWGMGV